MTATSDGPHHARPRRRRRGLLGVAAVVCLALVAGIAVALTHRTSAGSGPRPVAAPTASPAASPSPTPSPSPTASSSPSPSASPLVLPPSLGGVTTFLLYTTGSRGMTAYDAHKYGITGFAARGNDGLTDSIILAVLDAGRRKLSLLSIPRDTWLDWRGTRINAVYDGYGGGVKGASAFSADVTRLTGIPVNHFVEINFTAAAQLTDVVGGVDIEIPRPMRDLKSHLYLPTAGCVRMDGRTTLAFSRSRHTSVYEDGRWHTDTSASDFGRAARQQAVVSAALRKLLSPQLLTYLPGLADVVRRAVRIDASLDYSALVQAARVLGAGPTMSVQHYGLPAFDARIGTAAVLRTDYASARPIVAQLVAEVPGAELPAAYGSAAGARPATPLPLDSSSSVVLDGFVTGPNGSYATCEGGTPPAPSASPR